MDLIIHTVLNLVVANPKPFLLFLLCTFVFWFLYATIMRVIQKRSEQQKGGLKWLAWTVLGYALLSVGFPYDVVYNYTWGSLVFWQFPRSGEWTFTQRLQRLVKDTGWRSVLARLTCRYLVEPWDAYHCGMGTLKR